MLRTTIFVLVADGTCGALENDLLPARVQQFQRLARRSTRPSQLFEGPDPDGDWAGGARATPAHDTGMGASNHLSLIHI